jgi:cyclopropane fatty-acyl-phospholipid synthase-like methyltransferase
MTSWYETFFSGLCVEFWIRAAPPPSPEELIFLRKQFAIDPGQSVLDIPCGAGRHAVPLAELGYKVTGFDISTQFLSEAQRFAQDRGVSVDWRLGDMRTLAFEGEFDAALCFGNSFGYLSRTDTKHFLKRLSAVLRDGAATNCASARQ